MVAILCGVAGMLVSFAFLASAGFENIVAGASGFVAGSILVAAGVLSAAVLDRIALPAREPGAGACPD
ncbi:MAG: hypothetical protein KDC87_02405 [Planctomycetes bacterium]|nr:hypothetical protein [Planctomycetota bacterium]MCB9871189.1 hypothetical protein [Planctomycetota bacterium]